MPPFLVAFLLVGLAEMGDRTQLLAILLASRYRAPVPILAGILVATIANHALAALVGVYLSGLLSAPWFRWAIAASFIAMAAWALVPDKADDDSPAARPRSGVFVTTVIAFFLVEIGDKTEIATAALAARFRQGIEVVAGATAGMMAANIPAVLFGGAVTRVMPLRVLRIAAALTYLALGLWGLAAAAGGAR